MPCRTKKSSSSCLTPETHARRSREIALEHRVAHRELGDPAVIERDQRARRRGVERDRLAARRGERAGVEQVALHEQGDVLERGPRQRGRLDQRLLLALFLARALVRELGRAALRELALGEHGGRDLAARDIDDRGRRAVRQADRIEDEHVALELAVRDPALRHRGDQVLVRDALEQGQTADQGVRPFESGWYHPARTDRGALLDGQVRHLARKRWRFRRKGHGWARGCHQSKSRARPAPPCFTA